MGLRFEQAQFQRGENVSTTLHLLRVIDLSFQRGISGRHRSEHLSRAHVHHDRRGLRRASASGECLSAQQGTPNR